MARVTKILAPTDFSEHSRRALDYAVFLARTFGAELTVLHVFEPPVHFGPEMKVQVGDGTTVLLSEFLERQALEALQSLTQQLEADTELRVSKRLMHGNPVEAILQAAKEGPYDLIVLGTHGRTGLSHLFAGSVAERVVRLAPCPVLTTKLEGEPLAGAGSAG